MHKKIIAVILCIGLYVVGMPVFVYAEEKETLHSYIVPEKVVEAVNPWDNTSDISWYDENEAEYTISTASHLAGLAQLVNEGNTFEGKTVCLANDIFLNGETYKYEWTPIALRDCVFNGTFSGNNHTIYNMFVSEKGNGGLFGSIGEKGIVKAVNISQGELYSGGCIANINEGMIAFCNNYSYVESDSAGGICNNNYNLVYGCKNYGDVWGDSVAGIVGTNKEILAVVSQCSNEGLVMGNIDAAGIVRYNYGWIYNCYNTGVISGSCPRDLAGIVFYNNSSCAAENCYFAGTFVYESLDIGGVCSPIVSEDYYKTEINCYALPSDTYTDIGLTNIISADEMTSAEFIEKLDCQTHTLLSAWMADEADINNGFPITVADYNYVNEKYKIQSELWMPEGQRQDLELEVGANYKLSFECYYNEVEPEVTIEDATIAKIVCEEGAWYIRTLKAGNSKVKIHFFETENNISGDYEFYLKITEQDESFDSTEDVVSLSQNGWHEVNGAKYWYENGVKQGTEGRGKEIYDKVSDAWYWLDAPDGKMAFSKDVYQESLAGAWGDYIGADGERYGKWVRYDENGHMVKGWQNTSNGTYFFDYTYGTMAKGFATIEKTEYYFNKETGVLERELGEVPEIGWKNVDGVDYWYEGYVRQGYSVNENYRGKEIFDEGSNAWYWLDNVDGGKKAVSKDVYQESLAGEWGDYVGEDGQRYGKWVRYDENGHMIKGWNTNENGTYYFDPIYGTMAKGEAVIEGVTYHFDASTGILQ